MAPIRSCQRHTHPMEKKVKKHWREQGLTLLEVIVATSILTFGLLAVASMQTASIRGNAFANRLTQGATWAQDKLEELMALPDNDNQLSAGNHDPETAMSGNNSYTIRWTVDPAIPVDNAKLITVTVTWRDRGVERTTELKCVRPQFF